MLPIMLKKKKWWNFIAFKGILYNVYKKWYETDIWLSLKEKNWVAKAQLEYFFFFATL